MITEEQVLTALGTVVDVVEVAVGTLKQIDDELRLPTPDSVAVVRQLLEDSKTRLAPLEAALWKHIGEL